MKVAYIGNFRPEFSTENHIAQALRHLSHEVHLCQEDQIGSWKHLEPRDFDLLLWTRTGWPWMSMGLTEDEVKMHQRNLLHLFRSHGVPSVGYHLDRWWGLQRETEIHDGWPFFQVDHLITADGGHDEQWKEAGINHHWLPPGVSAFECSPGRETPQFVSDIAFVGSWQNYHPEWQHRFELVNHLRRYPTRFWPEPGCEAVRGDALRDLYASTKINVGDSCLVGGQSRYWSDRIPETLGRGGFLIHPYVDGLWDFFDSDMLVTWELWNWEQLDELIEYYLHDNVTRGRIAQRGREQVLKYHTYTFRMQQMMDFL